MNEQQFQQLLEKKGVSLTNTQLEQFNTYYETLIEWNEKMNLTGITEKNEVYEKHFFDSLSAAFACDFTKITTVCDVGSGAGFPSIPLKICYPHLNISIVDSLKKRITFLNHLVNELKIEKVALYHDRAETFARNPKFREAFDLVTARAVAKLSVLSELCLPLVKETGTFLVMKGPRITEEVSEAEHAISLLGGEITDKITTELPFEKSDRNLLLITKKKRTPKKYPRKPGTPNKEPL
ncbi:16S rRNA (guanine(527)-N(7))-methyltransferase RsmG [Pueribacillus theae]|uniref:Ribosomal RNA small subunit methyltransferase G n=1 Tax=Pueribacillus theae TaxID=2171751 RepID=A0A2U1JNZ8_9BACI|nr:16S rRNA (guanine(527)-N(7))-methyltransferase RsmG [Pueribacillus theae]PWA06704.1 16S rRNA (guanine(527)-N(7))-methyltransferase RsmG [Pueribacillus theae]